MIYVLIIWLTIGLCVADKKYGFIEEIQDDFNIYSAYKTIGKFLLTVIAWPIFLKEW